MQQPGKGPWGYLQGPITRDYLPQAGKQGLPDLGRLGKPGLPISVRCAPGVTAATYRTRRCCMPGPMDFPIPGQGQGAGTGVPYPLPVRQGPFLQGGKGK